MVQSVGKLSPSRRRWHTSNFVVGHPSIYITLAPLSPTLSPPLALQHRIRSCIQTFLLTADLEVVTSRAIKHHVTTQLGVKKVVDYDRVWLKAETVKLHAIAILEFEEATAAAAAAGEAAAAAAVAAENTAAADGDSSPPESDEG